MFRIGGDIRPVVFKFAVADVEIAVETFDSIAFVVPEMTAVKGKVVVVEPEESGSLVFSAEEAALTGLPLLYCFYPSR